MDLQLLTDILSVLKLSTDKAVILKGLIKLRSDVVKNNEGIIMFREAGGIPVVIRFLGKPWEQILEVSLSIIGNCCTDEASCREALNNKVVGQLMTILKCHPNSSIQCRACRLLGNLAKADVNRVMLANGSLSIAKTVCLIIRETKDIATRMMAFRACRFLMSDMQFSKHFLQANGFHLILANLVSTLKTNIQNESGNTEKLLNDVQQQQHLPHICHANDIKIGLKQSQHREKYFEEVARNLEGVRSDIWDQVVFKNTKRTSAVSHTYAMPTDKIAMDLVCEMLKCLLVLSDLQIDSTVWESLSRASYTLAPIVYFVEVMQDNNKHHGMALRILSNFSKNRGSFYMLSSADAITAACELLVKASAEKPLNNHDTRHCINIITILSMDACNRSKIRRSGALKNLIALLRDSKSSSEKVSILCVFLNFQYDDMSMELMLREGLVGILIKELNYFISSDEEYYKRKREEKLQLTKKRKLNDTNPNQMKTKCKFVRMKEDCCTYDCDSPSSSPRSQITPSSPCSSRSMSPMADTLLTDKDPDEDSYSPVCTDDDEDDDDEDHDHNTKSSNLYINPNANKNDNHTVIMHLLSQATRTEDNNAFDKDDVEDNDNVADVDDDDDVIGENVPNENIPATTLPQIGNLSHNAIDIIENLLFRVTCMVKKSLDLGKLETINTLIKAIRMFGGNNTDFTNILTNIMTESQFFGQIIKQGIPYQVYQLTKLEEMNKDGIVILDTLTSMGECNYGKEELFRLLRCDCYWSQNRSAIAIGFIIRNKSLLYQFLNDGNVFGILLSIALANTDNNNLNVEAADSITCMSRFSLDIKVPTIDLTQYNEYQFHEQINESNDKLLDKDMLDMRFLIYEDTMCNNTPPLPVIVPFNKAILCSCSEVFKTMLNSDFREGNDGEIHLRSCTVNGLRYFLQLLIQISKQMDLNIIPPESQHYTLLEAFEMSRIYIIPEMEHCIQNMLIATLNEANCLNVFEWAIKNYHIELTEMTISYYLSALLNSDIKLQLFRAADSAHYSSQWFQMLNDAILTKCNSYIVRS